MRRTRILLLSAALLLAEQPVFADAFAQGFGDEPWGGPGEFRVAGRTGTDIRVLLFETSGPVTVAAGGVEYRLTFARSSGARSSGVRVNGGAVRARFRVDGGAAAVRVRDLAVRGSVEVVPAGGTSLVVVNALPLEAYLHGTLGNEMYGSWSAAALKAQAVASRTYALQQMGARSGKSWHVRSGTLSQVYAGVASESAAVRDAVRATAGEILVHDGEPILAAFHSSSGGRTASAEETWGGARAYLVSIDVDDEWESPDAYWRATVSRTTLGRAVAAATQEVGRILDIEVLARTGSGRVARVRVTGDRTSVTVTGGKLRSALGERTLKSTLFEVREAEDGFLFVGAGNGHGVGMSQWGARAMAERGDSYQDILRVFYPGAVLRSMLDTPAQVSARGTIR